MARRSKGKGRKSSKRGTGGSRTYRAKSGSVYKLTKVASGLKGRKKAVRRSRKKAKRGKKARKSGRGRRRR